MEIEGKYLAESLAVLRQAEQFLTNMTAADEKKSCVQTDIYYDTRGGVLASSGASLRVREKDGKRKLTIKGPARREGARFDREENEFPLRSPNWEEQKEAVFRLLPMLPLNSRLFDALTVENSRRTYLLDGKVEAAFDTVHYRRGHAYVGPDYQLELEVKAEGGEELLEKLMAAMAAITGLTAMEQSKYQRGLELTK